MRMGEARTRGKTAPRGHRGLGPDGLGPLRLPVTSLKPTAVLTFKPTPHFVHRGTFQDPGPLRKVPTRRPGGNAGSFFFFLSAPWGSGRAQGGAARGREPFRFASGNGAPATAVAPRAPHPRSPSGPAPSYGRTDHGAVRVRGNRAPSPLVPSARLYLS